MTKNLLFGDKNLGIAVCSRKCEHEYLEKLIAGSAEHRVLVEHLDRKIASYGTRNRIGWGFSAAGTVFILSAVFLRDVNLFLAGIIIASISGVATRHFEDTAKKLTIQRKRLAI